METYTFACTAQKMKFFIKNFFSKCDQLSSFLRIYSHLLTKSLIENFIFCAVLIDKWDIEFLSYLETKTWVLVPN